MARPTMPESELHTIEIHVRFRPEDGQMIIAAARRLGVKPAVLVRMLTKKNLYYALAEGSLQTPLMQ